MARSNVDDVKDILDTDLSDAQITAFLNVANRLVTAHLTDKGLASTTLQDIEMFLAAHLASHRDMRAERESIAGEYSVTYQGDTGMGLDATFYGQTVKQLDSSGTLASLGQKRASLTVMTTPKHNTDALREP